MWGMSPVLPWQELARESRDAQMRLGNVIGTITRSDACVFHEHGKRNYSSTCDRRIRIPPPYTYVLTHTIAQIISSDHAHVN